MNTDVKPDFKLKTFCISKSYSRLREKEFRVFDLKFYQKILVVFISLSTILIYPESPKELENICEFYNSSKLCNVW